MTKTKTPYNVGAPGKSSTVKSDLVYEYIKEYMSRHHHIPPSIREIRSALDISSTSTVAYYIANLEKRGKVMRIPNIARGIVILNAE